jgi:YceG-like family
VTEQPGGGDRLPAGAYRNQAMAAGASGAGGGGLTRRERREARENAARQTGGRRAGRAAKAAAPTATRTNAPPLPAWAEATTDPTPLVDVGRGGGGGNGRGGGRGGGGGGRGGNGRGDQAARRAVLVGLVLGALTIPILLVAVVTLAPDILSGSGPSKPTPKSAPAGQLQLLLRPGLTVSQIGDVIGTLPGHTKASFVALANQGTIRSKYQPAGVNNPEGMLYPDTYFVLPTESDQSILRRLVNRFDAIGDQIGLGGATATTPYNTVVIASMVQQEAKLPSDAPLVAAVIYNRIKNHMPLQIDATLCYVKGGCPPVPTNADKRLVSPYNTYKVAGLPPTPIASVTASAMQAALQPASVPYLYYVISDSTGKLAFATTLREQDHNIALAHRKGLL